MNELQCIHGVGHKVETHGCDGCCLVFGKATEERIIKVLEDKKVIRTDFTGNYVFINCNNLEVEYLKPALIKGEVDSGRSD